MKSGDVKYGKAKATWGHKGNKRNRRREFISNVPSKDYSKILIGVLITIVIGIVIIVLW